MPDKPANKSASRAESMTAHEGLEPVRKRPGMYIGTTGVDGLHHLIWEIFDNSRDEAMGGFADRIEIALLPGNRVRVADNGRGIPVDIHKKTKVSALETVMTTLHAGGKFGGEGYKVSGGLHGVGASVVNALSRYARVEVYRDGGHFMQEYAQGKKKASVKKLGPSKLHGTVVTFEPDPEIFKEIRFDWNVIVSHMRQQAYLVRGLRIAILDLRGYTGKLDEDASYYLSDLGYDAPSTSFYFEGGLVSLVKFYNQLQKSVHRNIFYVEKEHEGVHVEIALQYIDDIATKISAFANNTYNAEGGTHVTGFKTALTRLINNYGRKNNIIKEKDENFTGEDVLEGLTAVISVKLREVQFEGQTKAKLGSVEAQGAVAAVFGEGFDAFLEEHPDDAREIIGKAVLALRARKAAKAAKDSVLRKGALEGMTLPGKLADCQTREASEAELFIVEGDSAGGCFSGDTKVALADGRDLSFEELIKEYAQGKKNYCYTIGEFGDIEIQEILHPRITKKNAKVIKIILDNGEEIICTPAHKFMLRDGTYREAHELSVSDSLMPLNRQISRLGKRITIQGYELVFTPGSNRWIFTHLLSDQYNLKRGIYEKITGDTVHHKNFNKRDNNPDNVVRMDKQAHLLHHTRFLGKTLHSDASKQKAREAHALPEYREKIRKIMSMPKMRALLSTRAKQQWENEAYKKYMAEAFLRFRNGNNDYRRETDARLFKLQKEYWARPENRSKQSERTRAYFEQHPEFRKKYSEKAKAQWTSSDLRAWRSTTTKKQWTNEFRNKRKKAYNATYLQKGLKVLHDIYLAFGRVDYGKYDTVRKTTNDKSLLRVDTLRDRFFGGNIPRFEEAVMRYNHRIASIEPLSRPTDVYDLEVPGTHNFALASGVFVHNSSKQGRDRRTQAILPLKGKILNVERARLDKMLASQEIKYLVVALGTAIGDAFDLSRLRYHKVIIATDADVDGAHIRTLLLTLFYRYFRPLIEGGYIYIAQPPLYKIKKGKEFFYFYNEEEKAKFVKKEAGDASEIEEIEVPETAEGETEEEGEEDGEKGKKKPKLSVQRYKGLGEMNPEELWETTMDPARRIVKQVSIEDAEDADKVFETLMGNDVPSRKSFIQSNAKHANIDI
ncbi:MAG: ATP-binding protein [bacterium]|nr:ATP-binding protein [bacterium]